MKLPAPGLQPIPVKSEGDLTYQLTHRGEFSDRKERPRPPLRRPLGAPTPPEAPKPLPEWVDSEPQIRGTAKFSMTAELRYQRQGDRVSGDVASSDRPELRVQEELSDFKDKIVALVGFGDPARFRVGMPFAGQTAAGNSVSGKMNMDGRGTYSGRISGRSPRGGYSDADVANPGQGRSSIHAEGRTDDGKPFKYDATAPTAAPGPSGERQVLRLELRERDCWLMKGSVDTKEMEQSFQAAGISVEIIESEWTATLEQRDVAFEQAVERFVRAPIPANMTWQYVDGIAAEFERLRGSTPTDYRSCVLASAQTKLLRVQVAALKVYLDSYPKVSQGATPPVLGAANVRILGILQRLQFLGIECQLATAARKMIDEQAQKAWAKWPDYDPDAPFRRR